MARTQFSMAHSVGWARWLSWLLVCVALSWGGVAAGMPVDAPLPAPVATPAGAQVESPADAPELPSTELALPAVPSDFRTQDLGWLHLAYAPELERWAEPLLEAGRAFRGELTNRLGQDVLSRVHVRLATQPSEMRKLAPAGAAYPAYAEGVAYSRLGLILLTDAAGEGREAHDLLTTFRHELAHVALFDALDGQRVPLWFNEGLAVHLSRENAFARTQSLWSASLSGNLIPLDQLSRRFPADPVGVPVAYAQSADIVRYLLATQDQERFRLLIARLRREQPFDRALYDAYGLDQYNLEQTWKQNVESRFSFWPVLFSGTVLWTVAVILVTLAWRRKRTKQQVTLERWAREEATAERVAPAAVVSAPPEPPPWLANVPAGSMPPPPASHRARASSVPKVEHDGDWHTLH